MAHRISPTEGPLGGFDIGPSDPLALHTRPLWVRALRARLRARLRRSRLKPRCSLRERFPCESPALAHRAAQLTSERNRQRLASWVGGSFPGEPPASSVFGDG